MASNMAGKSQIVRKSLIMSVFQTCQEVSQGERKDPKYIMNPLKADWEVLIIVRKNFKLRQ